MGWFVCLFDYEGGRGEEGRFDKADEARWVGLRCEIAVGEMGCGVEG